MPMTDPETAQKINEMCENLLQSGLATNRSEAYERAKEIILGPESGHEEKDAVKTEEEIDRMEDDINRSQDSHVHIDKNVNKMVEDMKRHEEGKDTAQYFIDSTSKEEEE